MRSLAAILALLRVLRQPRPQPNPYRRAASALPTSAPKRNRNKNSSPSRSKTSRRRPHHSHRRAASGRNPEDHKTAEFVARKFRAAGLETEIVPYRVLLDYPKAVHVEAWDESGHPLMTGPTREHVNGDPQQDDPRIVMPYNSSSGSGDVTGQVIYANYCRLEDFDTLAAQHIDVHGKIVMCRYGTNFRGVKVYLAEQRGAIAVLIYSDPQDDGYYKGDPYPTGPWRPDTSVQRGSVQYLFKYSGDPETPGVASTLDLPDSARIKDFTGPDGNQPRIISIPLSAHDAAPILAALKGPGVPQGWQGALPFPYHLGPAGVKVHLVSVAGLPAPHHLGCHWKNPRRCRSRLARHRRQSSRRVGLRRSRSLQRNRRHA